MQPHVPLSSISRTLRMRLANPRALVVAVTAFVLVVAAVLGTGEGGQAFRSAPEHTQTRSAAGQRLEAIIPIDSLWRLYREHAAEAAHHTGKLVGTYGTVRAIRHPNSSPAVLILSSFTDTMR